MKTEIYKRFSARNVFAYLFFFIWLCAVVIGMGISYIVNIVFLGILIITGIVITSHELYYFLLKKPRITIDEDNLVIFELFHKNSYSNITFIDVTISTYVGYEIRALFNRNIDEEYYIKISYLHQNGKVRSLIIRDKYSMCLGEIKSVISDSMAIHNITDEYGVEAVEKLIHEVKRKKIINKEILNILYVMVPILLIYSFLTFFSSNESVYIVFIIGMGLNFIVSLGLFMAHKFFYILTLKEVSFYWILIAILGSIELLVISIKLVINYLQ